MGIMYEAEVMTFSYRLIVVQHCFIVAHHCIWKTDIQTGKPAMPPIFPIQSNVLNLLRTVASPYVGDPLGTLLVIFYVPYYPFRHPHVWKNSGIVN